MTGEEAWRAIRFADRTDAGRQLAVIDPEAIAVLGIRNGTLDAIAERETAELRRRNPRRLLLAVPVCPPETARLLREDADEMVCLQAPPRFLGVGQWYEDFSQVSDEEVLAVLEESHSAAV